MARRLRIPGLLDMVRTDEPREIGLLSGEARLDRRFDPRGPLLNRLLLRRVRTVLTLGGQRLPSVAPRDDAARAEGQAKLERRLTPEPGGMVWDEETVEALAAAVRGIGDAPPLGPAAQQAIGRLFVEGYVGDAASWQAARDLDAAVRTRNPLRYLALRLGGRLGKAHRILSERAGGDIAGVHATGIAVHNIVQGLERMQGLWRDTALRPRLSADAVVGRCLFAPEGVLRQATEAGATAAGPLRPGTIVVLALQAARRRDPGATTTFMAGTWARCPAGRAVPQLLAAVWQRALAAEGVQAAGGADAAAPAAPARPGRRRPSRRSAITGAPSS